MLEWLVGSLGALFFVAILGVLVWHGAKGQDSGPIIEARITEIEQTESGFIATFEARNNGDTAAAQVRILAVLTGATGGESHEAMIDFLPAQSTRGGGFFFRSDPRRAQFEVRADGYSDP
ncbi:MAG: hypothetical protein ABW199_00710 [Caulobacterales bacterium]